MLVVPAHRGRGALLPALLRDGVSTVVNAAGCSSWALLRGCHVSVVNANVA